MEAGFWLGRWQRHEIWLPPGQINPTCRPTWRTMRLGPASLVLRSPLCAQGTDMGCFTPGATALLGVELSALALRSSYAEQQARAAPLSGRPWSAGSAGATGSSSVISSSWMRPPLRRRRRLRPCGADRPPTAAAPPQYRAPSHQPSPARASPPVDAAADHGLSAGAYERAALFRPEAEVRELFETRFFCRPPARQPRQMR